MLSFAANGQFFAYVIIGQTDGFKFLLFNNEYYSLFKENLKNAVSPVSLQSLKLTLPFPGDSTLQTDDFHGSNITNTVQTEDDLDYGNLHFRISLWVGLVLNHLKKQSLKK